MYTLATINLCDKIEKSILLLRLISIKLTNGSTLEAVISVIPMQLGVQSLDKASMCLELDY